MKTENLRKSVSLLLILLIMFLSNFSAFAEEFNEMPKIQKQEITQTISRLDAIKIAKDFKMNFDGDNVLKYNSEQDALELSNREVYELLDMKEDLIAYLVLTEDGYIVVNANAENPGVLMTSEYGDSLKDINQKLSEDSSLYFIFPFKILTEKERDEYVITNKLNIEDIISVPKITLSSNNSISPSSSNISVELKDEANFVKLRDDDGINWYGGDQDWFIDKVNRDKGCGVIALTNVVSHLAKYGYPKLYNDGSTNLPVNYNNYRHKMEGIAENYLSPGLIGIPFVANYNKGANSFFKDKGYSNLEAQTFSSNYPTNIQNALKANQPVPMLIWSDGSGNRLDTHWITITKYFKNASTNEQFIALSTWGDRKSINLDAILSGYVRGATYMKSK